MFVNVEKQSEVEHNLASSLVIREVRYQPTMPLSLQQIPHDYLG